MAILPFYNYNINITFLSLNINKKLMLFLQYALQRIKYSAVLILVPLFGRVFLGEGGRGMVLRWRKEKGCGVWVMEIRFL